MSFEERGETMRHRWKSELMGMEGAIPRRLLLRFCAGCVAVAALTVSAGASAQHYYGILQRSNIPAGDADLGISVSLYTDVLNTQDCNGNFVDHEMWYGLNGNGDYWVEAGYTDGSATSGACEQKAIFWADNRNGGGYHEYYPGNSWSLDTFYTVYVYQSASCTWDIYAGNVRIGRSSSNCPGTGRYAGAGIEATTQGGAVRGYLDYPQRNNGSGWQNGWDGATLYQNSPP